ncbi:MAG: NRDE family protein [Gammaproteobacteria bacterium]|nr:NRDE family protein [Gammaproteobacteria bacterium]
MCLLVFAVDRHPRYSFVFAGNRDEFHSRPARAAQWWEDRDLLGGRDELAGGTWLGLRRDSSFGVVTNFREMTPRRDDSRSRGELITAFMQYGDPFLAKLEKRAGQYSGYSLIAGNLANCRLQYRSNRASERQIETGVHGLSNHQLDTPWPKLDRSVCRLGRILEKPVIETTELFDLLADREQAATDSLPDTGIGRELEQLLSSPFIVSPNYGTRCSTAILLDRSGLLQFVERSFDVDGKTTGENQFEFQVSH